MRDACREMEAKKRGRQESQGLQVNKTRSNKRKQEYVCRGLSYFGLQSLCCSAMDTNVYTIFMSSSGWALELSNTIEVERPGEILGVIPLITLSDGIFFQTFFP